MKKGLVILALGMMGFTSLANAQLSCKPGQKLVCIQTQCRPGSIGCRDNPPPPNCFCADEPQPAPVQGPGSCPAGQHIESYDAPPCHFYACTIYTKCVND